MKKLAVVFCCILSMNLSANWYEWIAFRGNVPEVLQKSHEVDKIQRWKKQQEVSARHVKELERRASSESSSGDCARACKALGSMSLAASVLVPLSIYLAS